MNAGFQIIPSSYAVTHTSINSQTVKTIQYIITHFFCKERSISDKHPAITIRVDFTLRKSSENTVHFYYV